MNAPVEEAIVRFRRVSFAYAENTVLTDVSFLINRGDFVSVIGPNGGGKTTIARLMLGLVQPTVGSVELFGRTPAQSRSRVGYVPQYSHFDPQFPISVIDVVLMGRMARAIGFPGRKDRKAAVDSLGEVGLAEAAGKQFAELSGGQRQRVLIARALSGSPEILLLDEPTANIDISVELRLSSLLESLSDRMTIVLVTHDLGFVSNLVKKVLCVNNRARIHPTYEVTSDMIHALYEGPIKMVRHDQVQHEE